MKRRILTGAAIALLSSLGYWYFASSPVAYLLGGGLHTIGGGGGGVALAFVNAGTIPLDGTTVGANIASAPYTISAGAQEGLVFCVSGDLTPGNGGLDDIQSVSYGATTVTVPITKSTANYGSGGSRSMYLFYIPLGNTVAGTATASIKLNGADSHRMAATIGEYANIQQSATADAITVDNPLIGGQPHLYSTNAPNSALAICTGAANGTLDVTTGAVLRAQSEFSVNRLFGSGITFPTGGTHPISWSTASTADGAAALAVSFAPFTGGLLSGSAGTLLTCGAGVLCTQ